MKTLIPCLLIIILSLAGCSTNSSDEQESGPLAGSDRDEHGCIGSAGYLWCERTHSCERPWELARKAGFENSEKGFLNYCNQLNSH